MKNYFLPSLLLTIVFSFLFTQTTKSQQVPQVPTTNMVAWYKSETLIDGTTWNDDKPTGSKFNLTKVSNGTPVEFVTKNFHRVALFSRTGKGDQRFSTPTGGTNPTWPIGSQSVTYYYVAKSGTTTGSYTHAITRGSNNTGLTTGFNDDASTPLTTIGNSITIR